MESDAAFFVAVVVQMMTITQQNDTMTFVGNKNHMKKQGKKTHKQ